jgi:alanyl-tRNA synthetase
MSRRGHEIRQSFIDYFKQRGHTPVPSSSLIPQADPTLLFTNAGMNQFKRVFLGDEARPYRRAVSSQKCVRAGGKHNDLENVGHTSRHHTFFEMLGNFSFGDYFKEDAIHFGWDYLTKVVGLPKDRLWVTIFREDEEAFELWKRIGVPTARIMRFDEKDNFWQMGETGPCGPCSEIHFDQGPAVPGDDVPNGAGDRVIEIWNLVFMQYNQNEHRQRLPLPKPSIDTGMGLERLAAVVQGKTSNYESDLFLPIIRAIEDFSGRRYGTSGQDDLAFRVITDHLRAITFMVADGILPSNEGRGYVLRRILRRAGRYGRLLGLGMTGPFLYQLTDSVVREMKVAYPEVERASDTIKQVTQAEEERFLDTLDKGLRLLDDIIFEAKRARKTVLPGDALFKLYDTYGFPLDLAVDAAREQKLTVDMDGYQAALDEQRERARRTAGFEMEKIEPAVAEIAGRVTPTRFVGYDKLEEHGVVQAILKGDQLVREAVEGDIVELALDSTPFYAEGGGQVGDQGLLVGPEGRMEVQETTKPAPELYLHKGVVRAGRIQQGERLEAVVNRGTRRAAARNHTATHLVHAALRDILGPHVKQYGSLVAPNRLRFDFAHFKPLSSRDIDDIEGLVNEHVRRNDAVQTEIMDVHQAVATGALAFFGDKYGDRVRVVSINTFSRELCGGTHCGHTGEIGLFKIVSETGVAAGVRRIEAQSGSSAFDLLKQQERELGELAEVLKANRSDLLPKAKKLVGLLKDKEQELEKLKARVASSQTSANVGQQETVAGVRVYTQRLDGMEMKDLRNLADRLRAKNEFDVIVLGSTKDDKVSVLIASTTPKVPANELIKPLASEIGGSGGGRPEMAQAGGKSPERLGDALRQTFEWVKRVLSP